jgi:flagellar hook-associated protein 2
VSGLRLETQYEPLIQAIVNFERQPQRVLQDQRRDVNRQISALSTLDSRVSALNKMLTDFADPFGSALRGRAVTGGDEASYSVSATDDAPPGAHSLDVHRLAQADTRLTRQFARSGTDLRAFFDANGAQTFGIEVAAPTSDDPKARQTINVTVDPDGATDGEILQQIRTAVNDALGQAVEDETITARQRPSLSNVSETSDTARLSLRSAQTGYGGRFSFSDSADGLLALLEIGSDQVASGAGGGQVAAVGTSEETSDLSSSFTLNGLTMYRDTNNVSDALDGLTLTLSKAGTGASSFSVDPDTESIEEQVKSFIKTYNDVISYINEQSKIDADSGFRGTLAGDDLARGLSSRLRTVAIGNSSAGGELSRLGDLGIEIERDGTLKLADSERLKEIVTQNPESVSVLFGGGENSLGGRLQAQIEGYVGSNGVFSQRKQVNDSRVKRLDDQIDAFDVRMERRENSLRDQYARLQETISQLQSQQASFLSFYSSSFATGRF